jgi:hypothetical protein
MSEGPGRGGRMLRQRKTATVFQLLRGEDLEIVPRGLGVGHRYNDGLDARRSDGGLHRLRSPQRRVRRSACRPPWDPI